MKADHNRENLALVLALSRSHQKFLRVITPIFRQAGLTTSQWDILETLYSKGELSVNDLIEAALSTSGNLDVVIKNLLKAGLIEKKVAKHDSRSRMVTLTRAGRTKVEAFYPAHNRALEEIFRNIPLREKREMIKTLNLFRNKVPSVIEE